MIGNLTFHLLTQLTGPQELAVAPTSMLSRAPLLTIGYESDLSETDSPGSGIQRLAQAIRVSSPI